MFSPQVLDHFENPRNAGTLEDSTVSVRVENPACGDVLELSLCVESGRVSNVRFRAKGCVPAMACGSLVTELLAGKSLAEAQLLSKDSVLGAIGGLPPASGHAAQLAIDAVRAALRECARVS